MRSFNKRKLNDLKIIHGYLMWKTNGHSIQYAQKIRINISEHVF